MTDALQSQPIPALADLSIQLLAALEHRQIANTAREQDLDEALREARTWAHRRAARSERDRGCYRVGAALEPNDGHLIDDLFITGLDHLGAFGVALLTNIALQHPGESLSGLLRNLLASPVGNLIREWGVWGRRTWLRNLYWQETVDFLTSKKGMDPRQRWRDEQVTAQQAYLAGEIGRWLKLAVPNFANRGEAFEWIRRKGGNPRFLEPPTKPPLPSIPGVK